MPKFLLNDDALENVNFKQRRNGIGEKIEAFPLRDSDLLRPFNLIGRQNKQVWITVKILGNAAAGEYSSHLIFKVVEHEVARFEVIERVLPFSLPSPKTYCDPS